MSIDEEREFGSRNLRTEEEQTLSQVPAQCDCSVMPSFIVEAGLGQFGVRETENDCRVIARCDTFEDAMRIAKLLVAETSPNKELSTRKDGE